MLRNSYLALIVTFLLSILWLRFNDFLAHKGWINSRLSRKVIHIGTGPIFVLCWLLFPDEPIARYLAALVPLMITAQFALVGLGVIRDQAAVDAMSRTGDRREILRGPLFYGIVFVILTIIYWTRTPVGITALMLLCGGDGLADWIGQKYGRNGHLPWSPSKTWAGSAAVLLGGWSLAVLVILVYVEAGVFAGGATRYLLPLVWIALAGTVIESLPFRDIDNLTVPLAAVIVGAFLF